MSLTFSPIMPLFPLSPTPFAANFLGCMSTPEMDGAFYKALMENSRMTFLDYDPLMDQLTLSLVNPKGKREKRSLPGFLSTLPANALTPPCLCRSVQEAFTPFLSKSMRGCVSFCLDLQGVGAYRWYHGALQALENENGGVDRIIGYLRDIQGERLLEERATLDAVTGLLNRATLEERVCACLRESVTPCYFFIFDIDDFKAVNDTMGHAAGDQALKQIADVLRQYTRKTDLVGRIGGDEFVALLCGMPSQAYALERAQSILKAVNRIQSPAEGRGFQRGEKARASASFPARKRVMFARRRANSPPARQSRAIRMHSEGLRPLRTSPAAGYRQSESPAEGRGFQGFSLSIGIAASIPGQSVYEALYRAADKALYRAKALGKNQCQFSG